MQIDSFFLAAALFVVLLLVYLAGRSLFLNWQQEKNVVRRTEQWVSGGQPIYESESKKSGGGFLWTLLGLPGARKVDKKESIYSGTPLFYQRAGIYDASSLRAYQALRYVLFVLPFVGLALFHLSTAYPFDAKFLLVACVLAFVGFMGPVYWLRIKASGRRKQLDRTFPDAIDLLTVCVQAGMGLDAAINRVAREIHVTSPELGKELKILTLELKTGRARDLCLRNLAQRTDLPDIENLVNLLIQAERYGTGVANALSVHAEDMRHKRLARLEEKAAKLAVKMTVPLILFIFPALFVVILGPAAIQIFRHFIKG